MNRRWRGTWEHRADDARDWTHFKWLSSKMEIEVKRGFVRYTVPLLPLLDGLSPNAAMQVCERIMAQANREAATRERQLLQSVRRAVRERDGNRCTYCGRDGDPRKGPDGRPWHVDHIEPVARGGLDELDNLTLACATCNIAKSDDDPASWVMRAAQMRLSLDVVAAAEEILAEAP